MEVEIRGYKGYILKMELYGVKSYLVQLQTNEDAQIRLSKVKPEEIKVIKEEN